MGSEEVQRRFRGGSEEVQSRFRGGSEQVQSKFRAGSQQVQSLFRLGSEYVQSIFGVFFISSSSGSSVSVFGIFKTKIVTKHAQLLSIFYLKTEMQQNSLLKLNIIFLIYFDKSGAKQMQPATLICP